MTKESTCCFSFLNGSEIMFERQLGFLGDNAFPFRKSDGKGAS
jgi:hypothetical protein